MVNKNLKKKSKSTPKEEELLFGVGADWWNNACLNYMPDHWETYTLGYKCAGDILVEHVKHSHSEQDILVYPIVFSYRQYIELRLKEIIKSGNEILNNNQEYPAVHCIDKLWERCKEILKKIPEIIDEISSEDLSAGEKILRQFMKVDPTSQLFRYTTDTQGNKIPTDLKHINLRILSEGVGRLHLLLKKISTHISICLDRKQEANECVK